MRIGAAATRCSPLDAVLLLVRDSCGSSTRPPRSERASQAVRRRGHRTSITHRDGFGRHHSSLGVVVTRCDRVTRSPAMSVMHRGWGTGERDLWIAALGGA